MNYSWFFNNESHLLANGTNSSFTLTNAQFLMPATTSSSLPIG